MVNVCIIDTAGQERFRSLSDQFYKKTDGILLVYDITNPSSFTEITDYYYQKIKDNCKDDIKIIVLGNKTDLEEQRKIQPEIGANFAAEKGYLFMETSCYKNRTVADGFETLIELTYREKVQKTPQSNIDITQTQKTSKSSCC